MANPQRRDEVGFVHSVRPCGRWAGITSTVASAVSGIAQPGRRPSALPVVGVRRGALLVLRAVDALPANLTFPDAYERNNCYL